MALLMVLNDGETYTNLRGCKIVEIPDNLIDEPDIIDQTLRVLDNGGATSLASEVHVFNGTAPPTGDLFLVVWSGGYEAPQYETRTTDVEAWALARRWQAEVDPSKDWLEVLRIDRSTGVVEQLGSPE